MIANPSNCDEILLLGGYRKNKFYRYDIPTHSFSKISYKHYGTLRDLRTDRRKIYFSCAVSGVKADTIIMIGTFDINETRGGKKMFYAIYNSKTFQWEKHSYMDTSPRKNCLLFENTIMHDEGCKMIRYKKWLIISGGSNTFDKISIFEITDSMNTQFPKLIKTFTLGTPNVKSKYYYHGCIEIPIANNNSNNGCSTIIDSNSNFNLCQLLLFGGNQRMFIKSFCQINIDFDLLDILNVDSMNGISIIYNPSCWIKNLNNDWSLFPFCQYQFFNDNDVNNFYLYCFGYKFVFERYLIIIGGKVYVNRREPTSNDIFYFDIKNSHWYCLRTINSTILPNPICNINCIVYNDDTGNNNNNNNNNNSNTNLSKHLYLVMMGGCSNDWDDNQKNHWKLNMIRSVSWNVERVLWIGFYQTHKPVTCQISKLPKDIVKYILQFLNNIPVFQI